MGALHLKNAEKWYGDAQVIKGIDLEIEEGEFVVFVGPSGCGKSTLLRMIAGLEEISRGSLLIDDVDVTAQPPSQRGLAMVFQSYALYPHMSVRDNMGFSLKTAGCSPEEIKSKVDEAARALQLEALLDRRPKDLSGGQRQRVAIGRSIVRDPTAFLFDEPLSNLDAALRMGMRHEIAKLHQQLDTTMIYVTHDQVEAMTLADRIVVLRAGLIEQVGSPRELYESPANLFVAQFIGSPKMNSIEVSPQDQQLKLDSNSSESIASPNTATMLGIRPEAIELADVGSGHCNGEIDIVEYLGADLFLVIKTDLSTPLTVRVSSKHQLSVGDTVGLRFNTQELHFFDVEGQRVALV